MMKQSRYRKTPAETDEGQPRSHASRRENDAQETVDYSKVASAAFEHVNGEHYFLQKASTAELKRGAPESVTASNSRHSLVRPASFVTVDPARIDPHLVTLYHSDPLAAQQYRRLVVSLISLAAPRPSTRVLVTSAKHREGRTSVALNLAGALAQAKRRALV